MAPIQEKIKGKKLVSFKIKAWVGRDENGKQSMSLYYLVFPREIDQWQNPQRSPEGGDPVGG